MKHYQFRHGLSPYSFIHHLFCVSCSRSSHDSHALILAPYCWTEEFIVFNSQPIVDSKIHVQDLLDSLSSAVWHMLGHQNKDYELPQVPKAVWHPVPHYASVEPLKERVDNLGQSTNIHYIPIVTLAAVLACRTSAIVVSST